MATLEFLSQDLVHVPVSYSWISTKRFRLHGDGSDEAFLAALIEHVQYADSYSGGTVDESEPPIPIHGPYERAQISASTFVPSSVRDAREQIVVWATECAMDDRPADPADLARFLAEDLPAALHEAHANVYELPDIRASAEHGWGWVVGQLGFHEFVVIDDAHFELSLIVASDD